LPRIREYYWLGTWGNGLIRYDKSSKKSQNFLNKGDGGTILCLKINDDAIYAGSVGDGLFKINLKHLRLHSLPKKKVSRERVLTLFIRTQKEMCG